MGDIVEARRIAPVNELGHEITRGGEMAGFQGSAGDVGSLALHAGTASAVAREEAELKAAIVLSRANPRDELAAYNRIIKACQRPGMAQEAIYRFPRGGQQIEGPTVDIARMLALQWGNIRWGLRVVSEDEDRIHIKGYAYDLETNAYVEEEDKFAKLVQRKNRQTGKTEWVAPDERDTRELKNRRGAFCIRNAILQLIPSDVKEDAIRTCKETSTKVAAGQLSKDRTGTVRAMVMGFSELGVTTDMLSARLGHALEIITETEIVELRAIYTSIRDGQSKREEHFEMPGGAAPARSGAETLEALKNQTTAPAEQPKTPDEPKTVEKPKGIGDANAEPPEGMLLGGQEQPKTRRRTHAQ